MSLSQMSKQLERLLPSCALAQKCPMFGLECPLRAQAQLKLKLSVTSCSTVSIVRNSECPSVVEGDHGALPVGLDG